MPGKRSWRQFGEPDGSSRLASHHAASRWVVDDFGTRIRVRRCGRCRCWFEQGYENFSPRTRAASGHILRWDGFCRPCRREARREVWHRTPEEERRRQNRARWERIATDAERMAHRRRQNTEATRAYRRRDPERAQRQAREYMERVKADPVRYAAYLESVRMAYRLRAEREGRTVAPAPPRDIDSRRGPQVPGRPLALALDRLKTAVLSGNPFDTLPGEMSNEWNGEAEAFGEWLGITDRAIYAWRVGERGVTLTMADRMLTRSGLLWFDVWTPETVRVWALTVRVYRLRVVRGGTPRKRDLARVDTYGDLGPDYDELARIAELLGDGVMEAVA